MILAIAVVAVISAAAAYGFRGKIRKLLGKADTVATAEVAKVLPAIEKKL